jgi:hypothetical protein
MPDVSEIKNDGSMKFKKDKYYVDDEEFTVEGEWLNGVPHGVCIVETEDAKGVHTFTHGKDHGGPGWWIIKDGTRESWEYKSNSKLKGVYRTYHSDTLTCNVTSTTDVTPTPGCLESIIFETDESSGLDKKLFYFDDGEIAYGWFDEDGN